MNRISTPATFALFARVAVQRLLNQCGTMNLANLRKKKTTEAGSPIRSATLHRSKQASFIRRFCGLWLPAMTLLGLVMFSMNSIYAIVNTVALKESMNSEFLRMRAEDYDRLQKATVIENEAERKSAIEATLASAFSSSVPWQSDVAKKQAMQRFEASGIAAFKSIPADEPTVGLVTTLSREGRGAALRTVGLYLLILQLAVLCTAIGSFSKHLTTGDPDLVWLWQFPISRSVLFASKLVAYFFNNPSIMVTWLYYAFVVWLCGGSLEMGLGLGILFGISSAVTIAAIRLMTETLLVQKVNRTTRGMIVGWAVGLGSLCMLAAMFGSNSQAAVETFLEVAKAFPEWIGWNPFAAGIGTNAMMAETASWWMVAPATAVILSTAAVMSAVKMTEQGLAFNGDSARVKTQTKTRSSTSMNWLNAMVRKEFLQMRRQPEVIGQVVSAVGLVVLLMYLAGYQFLFDFATRGGSNICVAILIGTAYMLMVAAPLIMRSELKSLWMLHSLPRSLADLLRDKARVWTAVAMAFGLPMIATAIVLRPEETMTILARLPILGVTLWLTSELIIGATALSASVTNEQTITFKRGAMIAPTLAISNAAFAIMSDSLWLQISSLAMLFILNIAMRERQVVELAWLSEPMETPPTKIYAVHGLLAVIGFQTLISALTAAMTQQSLFSAAEVTTIAYFAAAIVVTVVVALWLKRNQLSLNTSATRGTVLRPIVWGLTGTCTAGLITILCYSWFEHDNPTPALAHMVVTRFAQYDRWFLLSMYVMAAPLFEEFLFRGMLYRTIRGSWGIVSSVAVTAALFTTLHPMASCIGVLTLGVVTALVVEKTGRLWPSMIIHSGYNAMIWAIWFL